MPEAEAERVETEFEESGPLKIANNKEIMGSRVNGRWSNLIGGIAAAAMIVSALAVVWPLATGQSG